MPYAADGIISEDQIEVGIDITAEQYQEALAGMLDGLVVTIAGGFKVAPPPPPPEPEPPTEPEQPIPIVVSRFQAMAALMQAGLLDQVTAWANDPATDPLHRLAFQTAGQFSEDSPALAAGAVALGLNAVQLSGLFLNGSKIKG